MTHGMSDHMAPMASMSPCPSGKMMWPELVGHNGYQAAKLIMKENPNVMTVVLRDNLFVTTEFDCKRVRIKVNAEGYVSEVPRIG